MMMRFLILLLIVPLTAIPARSAEMEFGSIGAQVVPVATGEVVVLQLVPDAPADQVGLKPGDLIISINGTSLKGLSFNVVTREYLWGKVGEPVHFTWLRPGETAERQADLVRVKIDPRLLQHPDVRMVAPKN